MRTPKREVFLFFAPVAALVLMILAVIAQYGAERMEFEAVCSVSGGVPIIVPGEMVCFAPSAVLKVVPR